MEEKNIICVIDDSPTFLSHISLFLRNMYRLKLFRSGKDFLKYTEKSKFDIPD